MTKPWYLFRPYWEVSWHLSRLHGGWADSKSWGSWKHGGRVHIFRDGFEVHTLGGSTIPKELAEYIISKYKEIS